MPGTHAFLSPSAAYRWLTCTPSAQLEYIVTEEQGEKDTDFAAEGTLAHAICAMKLKRYKKEDYLKEEKEIKSLEKYYASEMEEYTDGYASHVIGTFEKYKNQDKNSILLIEHFVNLSEWVPSSFGTVDASIISDGSLEIFDFKYGKGVEVSAEMNPQLMIYALGLYSYYHDFYNIENVILNIEQPRLANYSCFQISMKYLLQWAEETLIPKAREAWKREGALHLGDWCRFCKAKTVCRLLAETAINTSLEYAEGCLLSNDDIENKVLPNLPNIKNWAGAMEDALLKRALDGEKFKGWKIVEGRSLRRMKDTEKVKNALIGHGYDEADILKPEELRSLTDLERLVGKKEFAEYCGEYIIKPQGKPTLVPESDKRPEYNSATTDFQNF